MIIEKSKILKFIKATPIPIIVLFSFLFVLFFLTIIIPVNPYIGSTPTKIALNFAATVAAKCADYYSKNQSLPLIGLRTDYEGTIEINADNRIQLPEDYRCEILDSLVVVTHKDGVKTEVRWR